MSDTALEYLAGSVVRPDSLAVLRDGGRLSLRDLADRVSASRRTVKRTLNAMESRGWVRPTNGAYELTALGVAMLSAYETFRERSHTATRLRPFLEHVPASLFDLDIDVLADATVVTPDDDPTVIADRLVDLRSGATRIREYTPYLLLDSVRQFADQVGGDQLYPDVTLVVETDTPPRSSTEYAGVRDAGHGLGRRRSTPSRRSLVRIRHRRRMGLPRCGGRQRYAGCSAEKRRARTRLVGRTALRALSRRCGADIGRVNTPLHSIGAVR